ncbi:MAG: HNH endonuclease [Bdellovibrionales bacterium]|nr:HNH endonuclease [Bdellovibrionales bacterium]
MIRRFALSSIALATLLAPGLSFAFPMAPDEEATPGEYCTRSHDDYTEDRYEEGIPYCERNVSSGLKADIYEAYGIPARCRKHYTVDHLIPLSMGGSNDFTNLWPEAKGLTRTRLNLELDPYLELKEGKITQRVAVGRVLREKLNPSAPPSLSIGDNCD